MKIIRFSVNHPVTTCMLMLLLLMGGGFALSSMEVELLPSISIPTLVVVTENPKASPEDVHKDITLPMEESLNGVSGLVSLNAVSFEGESRLVMEFDWGRDVNLAEIEVREQVNALKLPDSARKPLIRKFDPSSAPIFRFDIFGNENADLDTETLRRVADTLIKPRLERIGGVGEVAVLGGTEPEYRVIGRPEKLAQYNLTVLSLVQCIQEEARNRKGGTLRIEGGKTASLRILGKAAGVADLENLVVATPAPGETIRVRDVATVIRTKKDAESYARFGGRPSVGLSIKKTSDASVVSVVERIREELAALSAAPAMREMQMRVSQDDSEYVINAQDMVLNSILQGVLLAGILLILFLRDIRATIVVGLATPVSIIAAFMCLKGLDLSRNVLTLGGMGLAAGMTLDSSIVLLDSIYKQLELGKPPREAAIGGASEVAAGIVSSNMTTVAVFLPILFIPGLMREIFKDLSYSIIWAMLFSMVVGILFIPMVSARILSAQGTNASRPPLVALLCRPWDGMCRIMDRFDRASERVLGGVLRFFLGSTPLKAATVALLVAGSLVSLYYLPGRGFLPQGQVNELWIRFETPVGSTLAYADSRIRQVEALLQQEPYARFVESVSADVRDDEAKLFVRLYPNKKLQKRNERGEKVDGWQTMRPEEWHSLALCVQQIREGCGSIPDLPGRTFVTVVDKVRGGSAAPITLKVYRRHAAAADNEGADLKRLQDEARTAMLPAFERIPSAIYQRVKVHETPKEIVINTDPRRQALHERGLSTRRVSETVRASVYGVQAESVYEDGREIDVTVLLAASGGKATDTTFDADGIRPLRVRSDATGALYEVREVAEVSDAPAEGGIVLERTNRKPTATLESHYAPYEITGETVGDVTTEIESALAATPGFAESYAYELKNTAKDTEESFADAAKAFLISIILVYMIMCSQFERFGDPLAIMITVPLCATGSVVMLHLTGEITSLGALVGAVILCGVVVNNGIILVEYVNILRSRGVSRNEAIVQGSMRKLRSILITSLTSILGMLPLVLGVGEGTELYRGVAAVIVGGLLVSTPLTLIALPLLYSLIDEAMDLAGAIGFRLSVLAGSK